MNPTELFLADGRPAGVWFCGQCRTVFGRATRDLAEACCVPRVCERCEGPVEERWAYTVCRACWSIRQDERVQMRWDAAEKLDAGTYDGGVYDEDGECFHHDVAEFLDAFYDEHEAAPERLPRLFATIPMPFRLEADRVVSDLLEHHHEDAYDELDAAELRQLQELLDAWCEANDPKSVEPDYSRAIVYAHLLDWSTTESA